MRRATWVAMAAGACASLALLAGRAHAATIWAALPLLVWLAAAARLAPPRASAWIQIAMILALGAAAGGHLGTDPRLPSFWDAVLVYQSMAIVAVLALGRGRAGLPAGYPTPTPLRRTLARAADLAAPVALMAGCCLAGAVVAWTEPPTPPRDLVYELPPGVEASGESIWCLAGSPCTWTLRFEAPDDQPDRLKPVLSDHLWWSRGWGMPAPGVPRCRSWGWVIREHACATVESWTDATVVIGGSAVGLHFAHSPWVVIEITYW